MWKHVRNLTILVVVLLIIFGVWVTRPDRAQLPLAATEGPAPKLPEPRPEVVPTVAIADAEGWPANAAPRVAQGLSIARYATGLAHPRSLFVLPNGDVLVAETNKPGGEGSGGITGWIQSWLFKKAGAGVPSANRITLIRDADGDGRPELKTPFITQGLNSLFGMALIGDTLYVANTDAVVAYPYQAGATRITAKPRLVYKLSAVAPNYHWTKNLIASRDGRYLYIAVGSNSNRGENGLEKEKGRAMVIQYDLKTGTPLPYSVGMRNPVGLAWQPGTDILWATVNERDQLGSDTPPDYLAQVEFGADYGWPQHYWGGYTDQRVQPEMPEKRQYERRPDYALGAHVAPLGLAFAAGSNLGPPFVNGAFVARHGSWNRVPRAGYDVVFVRFQGDKPVGKPVTVASSWLQDGNAYGRPTMLAVDRGGGLLVSDDVGGIVWRITGHSGPVPLVAKVPPDAKPPAPRR